MNIRTATAAANDPAALAADHAAYAAVLEFTLPYIAIAKDAAEAVGLTLVDLLAEERVRIGEGVERQTWSAYRATPRVGSYIPLNARSKVGVYLWVSLTQAAELAA